MIRLGSGGSLEAASDGWLTDGCWWRAQAASWRPPELAIRSPPRPSRFYDVGRRHDARFLRSCQLQRKRLVILEHGTNVLCSGSPGRSVIQVLTSGVAPSLGCAARSRLASIFHVRQALSSAASGAQHCRYCARSSCVASRGRVIAVPKRMACSIGGQVAD